MANGKTSTHIYAIAILAMMVMGSVTIYTGGDFNLASLIAPGSVPGVNFYVSTTETAVGYVSGAPLSNRIWGELFTSTSDYLGRPVNIITIPLVRPGPAIGIVEIGVFDQSGNVKYSFCDIPAGTIQQSKQEYTCYNNLSTYNLVADDVVGVKYPVGDYTNRIGVYVDTGNPEDGVGTVRTRLNSTGHWNLASTQDVIMLLGLAGPSDVPTGPPGSITITLPQAGQAVSQHSVTVLGTTTAQAGKTIQKVEVLARSPITTEGTSYVLASTGDNWRNWAATVDVTNPAWTRLLARITFTDAVVWHSPGVIVSYTPGGNPPPETNCADGIDNDNDGRIDAADSDCSTEPPDGNGSFLDNVLMYSNFRFVLIGGVVGIGLLGMGKLYAGKKR